MATQEGMQAALQTRSRRQKRSQAATLVLMGATPFAVLGLDPLHTDVRVFRNLQACHVVPLPGLLRRPRCGGGSPAPVNGTQVHIQKSM